MRDRTEYISIGERLRGKPRMAWPVLFWQRERGDWEESGRR